MFGQYSPNAQARRSKRTMVAEAARDHGAEIDFKAAKTPARNTLDYTLDGVRRVRLHDTDVVTIDRRGNITLDSGGWKSMTTKDRMNMALPSGWSVFAHRGWFVRTPQGTFPYTDGAKFKPDGSPFNAAKLERAEALVKKQKAMVAKFIKGACAKGWADPAGDPWVFSPDVGREVMLDWVKSGYFTARMMQLALMRAGFRETGISLYMADMARRGGKPDRYMAGQLRKYIYSQLGIV